MFAKEVHLWITGLYLCKHSQVLLGICEQGRGDLIILQSLKGKANWMLNPEDKYLNWEWGSFWTEKKNYFHQERCCIFKSATKKMKPIPLHLPCSYSNTALSLFPPPHIIKHIIITWLSARTSPRSVLALPGNQFVVTLCNPSKVIKWNELQLQRAFKNTGERGWGDGGVEKKRTREKMTTQPRNIPPLDSTSQVLKMKY